ncbi:methyltransferase [Nonomuraea sp. NPDC050310]|uniref:methyltransferase n=1 Tax=Nonomuraea sp. NPDC050310 TaxID=3154935 RepID=UPI0033F3F1BB
MPLLANPLEALAFRLSLVPPVLADYFGVLGFHSLLAGVRLGVFDALEARPMRPGELAVELGCAEASTASLLRALAGLGYLKVRRGRYALTRPARVWLCTSSPTCLAEGLEFCERSVVALWSGLEKAVRDGGPPVPLYTLTESDPELSRAFQAWVATLARQQAPFAARAIPVHRDARNLLDLGGSHAQYSIALLRRHPDLHATVLDLPQALTAAEPHPRLTLRAGSFLDDDLGEGFDLVLLFNVLHGLDDRQAAGLLSRVAAALNPGGTVVIGDQFRGRAPGRASRTLMDLLDLNYLVAGGGGVRTFAATAALLTAAGFHRPRHRRPLRSPATDLAVAVRA